MPNRPPHITAARLHELIERERMRKLLSVLKALAKKESV